MAQAKNTRRYHWTLLRLISSVIDYPIIKPISVINHHGLPRPEHRRDEARIVLLTGEEGISSPS